MIPTREQYQAIGALDLSGIAARLVYKEGFDAERAVNAVNMYKQFLRMVLVNPQNITVPNEDADKAWHHHILNTQTYESDCQSIFGKFLHHDPEFYDTPAFIKACEDTQKIAHKLFGENLDYLDLKVKQDNSSQSPAWCGGMLKVESEAKSPAWCGGMLKDVSEAKSPAWCGGMLKDVSEAKSPAWCGGMLKDVSEAKSPAWCGGMLKDVSEAKSPAWCGGMLKDPQQEQ